MSQNMHFFFEGLPKYFFAFLLNRIFFDEGTYFWGALPLNYISIFVPFYLIGFFLMRGPTLGGPAPELQ